MHQKPSQRFAVYSRGIFIPQYPKNFSALFQTLQQVMDFYNFRDTNPDKIYPAGSDGKAEKYNDIPMQYRGNVDINDPPFNRHPGDAPAMTAQDETDIIAFLQALNDGYKPEQ